MNKPSKKESKKEVRDRIKKALLENQKIVEKGVCPRCGTSLVPNHAIIGWWQCAAYPIVEMRKPEFRNLKECGFQCFTE